MFSILWHEKIYRVYFVFLDPLQEEDLRYIISELDDDWYQFGSNLNFPLHVLSQIRNYCAEDEKHQKMFKVSI